MKKVLYPLMAVLTLAALSCNKETPTDTQKEIQNTFSISANYDDASTGVSNLTKTSYENDVTFSWTTTDCLTFIVENGNYNNYTLHSNGTGASVEFSTQVLGTDGSGWNEAGYALYPSLYTWNGSSTQDNNTGVALGYIKGSSLSDLQVVLSKSIAPDSENPLSVIPLIGKKTGTLDERGATSGVNSNYSFSSAVGVLKLTLNGIPVSAKYIQLKSTDADYPLSGTFTITENDGKNYIAANKRVSAVDDDFYKIIEFTPTSASQSFYFPLPVGKIAANGLSVTLLDENENALSTASTIKKELTISRNEILETPALSVKGWTSLGTGKYVDYYVINSIVSNWSSKWYQNVDIQRLGTTSEYRIQNPYIVYFGTTTYGTVADEYLYLHINTDETVDYYDLYTGVGWNEHEIYLSKPGTTASNVIGGAQASGIPSTVYLAPVFHYYESKTAGAYTDYDYYKDKTNIVNIVFPGALVDEISAGTYYINGNSDYAVTLTKTDDTNFTLTSYTGKLTSYFSGECKGTYDSSNRTLTFAPVQTDASNQCFFAGEYDATANIVFKLQYDGRLISSTKIGVGKASYDSTTETWTVASNGGQHFGASVNCGEPALFPAD